MTAGKRCWYDPFREEAVKEGLIDEMGGIKEATDRLIEIINQSENK